ncbi:A disintegrin and metalloproteinase with thrombospondin motifs 7-like [Sapajus apella]|uniref:A disintegrin and metalloproteinase with thrombospondin motifs 7-like n=1 Tax=Sapajus apella TaxID=9515 RepID=A0A6J3HF42_SAPAP|nr:A disintegrin and metalloproteinase with thrombospondin motifs 7-like [Sapajus apella]XP_032128532.1 A disintegrin and metalloproteinase with thrombospondin motifs 7-like [Sapajus apella]
MLYKGKLHTWVPVVNDVNTCELHCRPSNEYFAKKLWDAVVDGTPCYQGRVSQDLCISGICKAKPIPGLLALETPASQGSLPLVSLDTVPALPQPGHRNPGLGPQRADCQYHGPPLPCVLHNVGCDFEINSGAMEDRCGVCHSNGSTCHTVSETFVEAEGLGYVDVGLIPAGARESRIQEVAEAANFLALQSEDPKKYFLNGGWTIQWYRDYQVAGTTFAYACRGNWENLASPGPTNEPVWIQLLFQDSNPGVRYEYTVHREADGHGEIPPPEFWHYGPWTKCTVTCGTGEKRDRHSPSSRGFGSGQGRWLQPPAHCWATTGLEVCFSELQLPICEMRLVIAPCPMPTVW